MTPRITTTSHDASAVLFKALPNILQRLNINPKHFIYLSQHFESSFKNLVGNTYHVKQACYELGQQWVQGIRQCEKYEGKQQLPMNICGLTKRKRQTY